MGDIKTSTEASSSSVMNDTVSSFLNNLTEELLNEILIRLASSKEAIRCKLVCKRWSSLISSHCFVTTSLIHHHNRNNNDKTFTLVLHYDYYAEYVELLPGMYQGLSRRVDLEFLRAGANVCFIMLEQSCGDLILCSGRNNRDYPNRDYYIFNILTKQCIALPPAPSRGANDGECGSFGFLIEPNCVDNARYEYLVLRFIRCDNSRFDMQMFSSEQGKWTELDVTSPRTLDPTSQKFSLIACGRMFYTLDVNNRCILAIDPFINDPAQVLRIIDLPLHEPRDIDGGRWKLGVCRGRLQVANVSFLQDGNCRPSEYPSISIWELEDYRMGKWTLEYQRKPKNTALRQPKLTRKNRNIVAVLAFHPNDEDLVCFVVGYRVVLYNIRTDEVQSSIVSSLFKGLHYPTFVASHYGSNVLPTAQKWWPTPLRQFI